MRTCLLLAALAGTATAAPKWFDTPAWPAKADAIDITWRVFPVPPNATTPETTKAPLEVDIAIGGVVRTVKLAPQLGALTGRNLPVCAKPGEPAAYPLASNEVAIITFYEGGAGGYFVRRSGGVLAIVDWSQTDGACEGKHHALVACPRHEKPFAQLHVPAGVRVREHVVEVDAKGASHPFDCSN